MRKKLGLPLGLLTLLVILLLPTPPNMMNPDKVLGTSGALKMAMAGFSSPALAGT